MKKPTHYTVKLNTKEYSILSPIPPFVDIILKNSDINEMEFLKIVDLTKSYKNDPRLIEMVRRAGDTSAKIPYLLQEGETPQSILATLRQVALPHVEHLLSLPVKIQSTIHTMLSVNKLPVGYEEFGIPALLEIDRIQREMVQTLKGLMAGRKMAEEFYQGNMHALHELDHEWPKLRQSQIPFWPKVMTIPEKSRMIYEGSFTEGRLKYIFETCVIVDPPKINDIKRFIPPVLQRPLSEKEIVPVTGSVDWLIREVGKVGRHFTRALLEIIVDHLKQEKIALDVKNYELITHESREALDDLIRSLP